MEKITNNPQVVLQFDKSIRSDYVDVSDGNGTPLIDIPIEFSGRAELGVDYH